MALVEQHRGEDFLRALLGCALRQVTKAEVGEITGDVKGEIAPEEREISRNGYRRRGWETRTGTIRQNFPKLRAGRCISRFFESCRISERVFAATDQEATSTGSPRAPWTG